MKKLIFIINLLIFFSILPMQREIELDIDTQVDCERIEKETLAKWLKTFFHSEDQIQSFTQSLSIRESLKLGCTVCSPEDATQKLQELFNGPSILGGYGGWWGGDRQKAANLINLGAFVNIKKRELSLLNQAVLWRDPLFVKFILERGAIPDKDSLYYTKSVLMAKLLIKYGAHPLKTNWGSCASDPLMLTLKDDYSPELLEFYITQYRFKPNKKWEILHHLFDESSNNNILKKKAFILLKYGVDPNEKYGHESAIETVQKKEPEIRDAFNEAINEYRKYIDDLKHILVVAIKCDYDLAEEIIQYSAHVI